MLYKTKRTCTVIGRTYNVYANLRYIHYRMIAVDYPELNHQILKCIRKYHDPYIVYLEKSIRRIPYFKSIPRDLLFDMIFKLEQKEYEKNRIIIKRN